MASQETTLANHRKQVLVPRSMQPRNYVPPLNFSLVEDGIYRSGFPMQISYPFLSQLKLKTIIYLGDLGDEKKKDKKKADSKEREANNKSDGNKGQKNKDNEKTANEHKDKEEKGNEHKDKEEKGNNEQDKKKKEDKPKKDKLSSAEIWETYRAWIATTDITFHHLVMHSSQEPFTSNTQEDAQKSLTEALQLMLNKDNFPILIHSNKGKHRIGVLVGLMRKILQGWCISGIFEEYEKFAMGKSEYDLEFIELWQPELSYDESKLPDFVRI